MLGVTSDNARFAQLEDQELSEKQIAGRFNVCSPLA